MPTISGASADSTSSEQGAAMPKAYIVTSYRSISNPDALAEYAKLTGPATIAAGGRFLARGNAAKAYEKGSGPAPCPNRVRQRGESRRRPRRPRLSGRIEGVGQRRRARHSRR